MDPLSLLLAFLLVYTGGFTHGYLYNNRECKEIVMEIPDELMSQLYITDCLEANGEVCSTGTPRYIVGENEYLKLNNYTKGMRVYLGGCKSTVERYNMDKYVD